MYRLSWQTGERLKGRWGGDIYVFFVSLSLSLMAYILLVLCIIVFVWCLVFMKHINNVCVCVCVCVCVRECLTHTVLCQDQKRAASQNSSSHLILISLLVLSLLVSPLPTMCKLSPHIVKSLQSRWFVYFITSFCHAMASNIQCFFLYWSIYVSLFFIPFFLFPGPSVSLSCPFFLFYVPSVSLSCSSFLFPVPLISLSRPSFLSYVPSFLSLVYPFLSPVYFLSVSFLTWLLRQQTKLEWLHTATLY